MKRTSFSVLACLVAIAGLGCDDGEPFSDQAAAGSSAGGNGSAATGGRAGASVRAGASGSSGKSAGAGGSSGTRGGTGGSSGTRGGTGGASGKTGGAGGASGKGAGAGGMSAKGGGAGAAGKAGSGGVGIAGSGGQGGAGATAGSGGAAAEAGAGGAGEAGGTDAGSGGMAGGGGGVPEGGGAGDGGSSGGGTGGGSGGPVGNAVVCDGPSGSAVPTLRLLPGTAALGDPLLVKNAPGDDARLFVMQQRGVIRIIVDGMLAPEPFYTVPALSVAGERGLLGMAFHPGYATNGRFYLHYSGLSGETVIEERVRGVNPDSAAGEGSSGTVILTVPQPEANHNGGSIEIGPDGYLYIALGDGGGGGDQHGPIGNGQSLQTLLGKILRLDVDVAVGALYAIPPNNLGGEARPEIWDYGLRNPFRMSFDACTGDLYIGDVGQGLWEEIDFEPKGEGRRNYGWRAREGKHCYDPALCSSDEPQVGMIEPIAEYGHESGRCSVIGGYVYRGSAVPSLRGTYLFADYCSHEVFTLRVVDGVATPAENVTDAIGATSIGNVLSFGQDNAGEVYVVTTNGIYVVAAGP